MNYSKNTLLLIWKEPQSRKNFVIGQLEKGSGYKFRYCPSVNEAIKFGFSTLIGFEDLNKTYESNILFPAFSSRLPDRKRRDISTILSKYDLSEYDEYLLLKHGGARLPIDTLEFAPMLDTPPLDAVINVAGTRHYLGCGKDDPSNDDCKNISISLNANDKILLVPEPDNTYDKNAIKLSTMGGVTIGYIPRYYSETILPFLDQTHSITCFVEEFNGKKPCEDCVKVRLKIE